MKIFINLLRFLIVPLLFVLISGCADKRPIKSLLPDVQRIEKAFFTNDPFYYSVTVVGSSADSPVTHLGDQSFGPSSLVQFEMGEHFLIARQLDPRYHEKTSTPEPLLSFPIEKHVDVEREKNDDDELTRKEIENDRDHPWNERKFANINFANTKLIPADILMLRLYESFGCISETDSDLKALTQDSDSLNITVSKTYKTMPNAECSFSSSSSSTFSVDIKISFLKKKENTTFKPTPYTKKQQAQIGLFSTTVKKLDVNNQPIEEDYAIHWDSSKRITYYLSPGFPEKYKSLVQRVVDNWNSTAQEALGKPLLELKENTGQELGDLRHNFIVWVDDPIEAGPGGYGPMRFDPFTGEIINAHAYIFAGNMKRALEVIGYEIENHKGQNGHSMHAVSALNKISSTSLKESPMNTKIDLQEIVNPQFSIRKFFKAREDKSKLLGALTQFKEKSGRCYYPMTVESPIDDTWFTEGLSQEEIFQRMISDTLVHEIGHTLGLRHNFKGSTDKKHFMSEKHQTSSVMDYLDIEDSEGGAPGPYDKEALTFGATGRFNVHDDYLYCTDENVAIDPFCNMFDRGASAQEIATYLQKRYIKRYPYRNLRGRKLHMKDTPEETEAYIGSLINIYYLPLREFMEYFLYTMEVGRDYPFKILRRENFEALQADLLKASSIAIDFFGGIIMDKEREYYDLLDPTLSGGELAGRGTRIDKILATEILTMRSLPLGAWEELKANYFDIPALQSKLLQLVNTATLDLSMQPLISFLLAYRFMSEVPMIGSRFQGTSRPTSQASEMFKIHKFPVSMESFEALDSDPQMEYFVDEDQHVIYAARKDPLLLAHIAPMAKLLEQYKETQGQLRDILTGLTEEEEASSATFSSFIGDLQAIQVKIENSAFTDLSTLTEKEISTLEKLLKPSIIAPTKEKLLTTLSTLEEKVQKIPFQFKREIIIAYKNEAPPENATEEVINERLETLKKSLPPEEAKEIADQLSELKKKVKTELAKIHAITPKIQAESHDKLSEFPEALRDEIRNFWGNISNGGTIFFEKEELITAVEMNKQQAVSALYAQKNQLDAIRDRIDLYQELYEKRGLHVE